MRRPYERAVVLRNRKDPAEILELHWYRREEDFEAARGRTTAQVQGLELDEPFPGLLVAPGTVVEELAFDDEPFLPAFGAPFGPPQRMLGEEERLRLRALLMALVRRVAPSLPSGFSLAFSHGSLLLLRNLEVLDEVDLSWAVEGPELLAQAVESALDRLQDTIAEETTDPWPGRGALPGAGTVVRDDAVQIWFGDPDEPVLAFEPIPLSELEPA